MRYVETRGARNKYLGGRERGARNTYLGEGERRKKKEFGGRE